MNNTMVSKFCTLKEAAEQLDTTQEQIEDLLGKGVLREFRDGPRRLLRTADVTAIAAARDRRNTRHGQPQIHDASGLFSSGDWDRSGYKRSGAIRPSTAADTARTPLRGALGSEAGATSRKGRDLAAEQPGCRLPLCRSLGRPVPSRDLSGTRSRTRPETATSQPNPSVRQWFWTGLTQDRPVTIALFSALILLALSALVAGACLWADIL